MESTGSSGTAAPPRWSTWTGSEVIAPLPRASHPWTSVLRATLVWADHVIEQRERGPGERLHVHGAVGYAGLDGVGALCAARVRRPNDGDAGVARGVAVPVAGRPRRA